MRDEGGSRNAEPREDGARLFGRGREDGMKFIGERVRHHGLDVMNGSAARHIGSALGAFAFCARSTLKAECASVQLVE